MFLTSNSDVKRIVFLQAKLEKFWKFLSHFAYIESGDRVPPPMNWLKMRFSRVLLFIGVR